MPLLQLHGFNGVFVLHFALLRSVDKILMMSQTAGRILQARVLAGGNYSGLSVGEAAPVTSLRTDLRDSTGTLSVTSDCVHQGLGKGSLVASRRTKLQVCFGEATPLASLAAKPKDLARSAVSEAGWAYSRSKRRLSQKDKKRSISEASKHLEKASSDLFADPQKE
ncbi:hypothetical protein MLD38_005219 [Melastoma candidum]|uniref:Uncharacterized protein n=1 Tax=Melastoma candidum TaxID=119954 RepID=A0ACB9SBF8_9MYRT|nr:hypothetical protein MLD38_005219 [Melastoma candidum]